VEAELLKLHKSGQFPDESVRIKGAQLHCVTSQTSYTGHIKEIVLRGL
jgi:hypothetical protein